MVSRTMPGKPKGIVTGHSWQGAIKRNGSPPTIYPHVHSVGHHIHGFTSKKDHMGKWSHGYKGKHS